MLVSLHGLTGGSHEEYLKETIRHLMAESQGEKWEMCVINGRGCAMSKITSGVLFNARATWDLRQLVKWLRQRFPNRPLFAIGYSLGANILTNYLGEEGSMCALKAAVVCSNPWNFEVTNLGLQRTWIGDHVYSKALAGNLKKLYYLHAEALQKHPRINPAEIAKVTRIHEFDRVVQCGTWGYPTEGAYYRDASSVDSVLAVRIPLLAINAEDDPISSLEAIPFEEIKQNPWVVLCTTSTGGHLSWFQLGGSRWFAKPAARYFAEMARKVDLSSIGGESTLTGHEHADPKSWDGKCSNFDPVRRKMHIEALA